MPETHIEHLKRFGADHHRQTRRAAYEELISLSLAAAENYHEWCPQATITAQAVSGVNSVLRR